MRRHWAASKAWRGYLDVINSAVYMTQLDWWRWDDFEETSVIGYLWTYVCMESRLFVSKGQEDIGGESISEPGSRF